MEKVEQSKYPPAPNVRVITPIPMFGEHSMQIVCGNCQRTVNTDVLPENGACVFLAAFILLVVFFPLFWIPLVGRSCKDVSHYCPACGALLGTFKRI